MPGEGGEVVKKLRPTSVTTSEKFGYMLETPPYPWLLNDLSDNAWGDADNQQGSRSVESTGLTPQRLHAELLAATVPVSSAYLLGALHDATISQMHRTVRYGQSDVGWLEGIAVLCTNLGQKSWIYREGRERNMWILETSSRWLTSASGLGSTEEQLAYARGYFDTEGGVPRDSTARFYIQLVQKNRIDLANLKAMLEGLGIVCGKLHNPSTRVDDALWRFYVAARSQRTFVESVGSWHPRKRALLERWIARMKI